MTHQPTNNTPETNPKKKIIIAALAGIGSILTLAGGITLASQHNNTDLEEPTEQTTQQPTADQQAHNKTLENTNPQPQDTQENNTMKQQNQPSPQNNTPAPQGNAVEELTQQEQDVLDAIMKNGNPNNDNYAEFIENASATEKFGTTITINEIEVTVSNPRMHNNQFTVDVKANNTADQTQGFSGVLFGAGPTPDKLEGPTLESMVALNTEPLAPHQKIEGPLSFDTTEGKVFYLDLRNGKSFVWDN